MAAPVAVAQHLLAAVRLAAQNKLATDPLSSPPSSHLKDTMKFKVYRDLAKLVSLIAAASSDGVNPLCLAGPQQEGAFVQVNQRLELSPGQVGFLFMFAVQFLHRAELPPLHKYCAPKKGAYTTPWRYAHEELRLYDPVARTYCAMYALTDALQAYFGFQLTRLQLHTIFLYSTATSRRPGLVAIEMDVLLAALKAQLPLPNMPGLTQDSTEADMCDMLLAPFKTLFCDLRDDFRNDLLAISQAW